MEEPVSNEPAGAPADSAESLARPVTAAELAALAEVVDVRLGQFMAVLGQVAGQLLSAQSAVQLELSSLQSAGPQRMLFGMYRKLFVELLQHMNQLDSLVELGKNGERTPAESVWIESLEVARNGLESTLIGWGVLPMPIRVNAEEFDPDRHEGVETAPEGGSAGNNIVVRVHRRGWTLNDVIIQYPQVAVS